MSRERTSPCFVALRPSRLPSRSSSLCSPWPRRSGPPCRRRPEASTPDGVSQGWHPGPVLEPGLRCDLLRRRRWRGPAPSTPRCGRCQHHEPAGTPPGVRLPERRPSTGGCVPSGRRHQRRLGHGFLRTRRPRRAPRSCSAPTRQRSWCSPRSRHCSRGRPCAGATATPSRSAPTRTSWTRRSSRATRPSPLLRRPRPARRDRLLLAGPGRRSGSRHRDPLVGRQRLPDRRTRHAGPGSPRRTARPPT